MLKQIEDTQAKAAEYGLKLTPAEAAFPVFIFAVQTPEMQTLTESPAAAADSKATPTKHLEVAASVSTFKTYNALSLSSVLEASKETASPWSIAAEAINVSTCLRLELPAVA
jgi:hypothetical protein